MCLYTMKRLRLTVKRLRFTCLAYLALAVLFGIIVSFIAMEGSLTKNQIFYDGPELGDTFNLGENGSLDKPEHVRVSWDEVNRDQAIAFNTRPVLLAKQLPPLVKEVNTFNCTKLFIGEQAELSRAIRFRQLLSNTFTNRADDDIRELTRNCEIFKITRGYWIKSPTVAEVKFQLAFNILFHTNIDQLERLLRLIYRPHNQYCIHVDGKTPETVLNIVIQLANCFDNVFIASQLEIVIYEGYTRLLADINCMKDHVNRGTKWNYLLNMAASELPIKTNAEIVQVLEILNGANDIHETFGTLQLRRYKTKHFTYIDEQAKTGRIVHSKKAKEDPPNELVITKGNAYNIFSRAFVEFVLENEVARRFLSWSSETLTPDEHYWATLNNLHDNSFLKTPGGYTGDPSKKPYIARYIGWNTNDTNDRCIAKRYVHNICVFGVEDLQRIHARPEMFANKFDTEYDPIAYRCMEEFVYRKTKEMHLIRNTRIYQNLLFIRKS